MLTSEPIGTTLAVVRNHTLPEALGPEQEGCRANAGCRNDEYGKGGALACHTQANICIRQPWKRGGG
jgi:hypothetical protein